MTMILTYVVKDIALNISAKGFNCPSLFKSYNKRSLKNMTVMLLSVLMNII